MKYTNEEKQQYKERDLKRRQLLIGKVKKLMDEGIKDIYLLMEKTGCKSETMIKRAIHAVELSEKRGIDPVLAQK